MSDLDLPEDRYVTTPDSDYNAEILEKKLKFKVANFAQVRFKHYMKMRLYEAQRV